MILRKTRFSLRRCWYFLPACLSVGLLLNSCGGNGASVGGSSSVGSVHSAVQPTVATPSVVFSSQPSAVAGSQTMPTATSTMTPAAVPVQLNYVLPTEATTSSIASRSIMSASTTGHLQYISTGNTLISIRVTPLGGSGTTYGPTACMSGACTISFTATPGPNTIAFTLTDGTNTLSTFSTTTIVQPAVQNTLNFTANPVVNSVTMTLANPAMNAGTAVTDLLTVTATDATGRTIVGPGNYVDVNGTPISLLLNVTDTQAGGNGTATLQGPARITGPSQAAIYLRYDGKWLDHATVSVTSTSPINGTLGSATFTATPKIYEYGGLSSPSSNTALALGPDGNIWFVEPTANKIGRITPQGSVSEFSSGLSGGAGLDAIGMGPDGNMWFSEAGLFDYGKITMNGKIIEYAPGFSGYPGAVTSGPDGYLWIDESTGAARMSVQGQLINYSAGFGSHGSIRNIVAGPDGNLWVTQDGVAVDRITTNGAVTETTAAGGEAITVGPDGNLWTASYTRNSVYKITPSLGVTAYPMTGRPVGITRGIDGNLWVSEQDGNTIDRVTTSGAVTLYSNGISASASPYAITQGSDGNLWFLEPGVSKIGKLVL